MRILIAATPATAHLDPILAVARLLVTNGHDVVVATGGIFRARVEATGAQFFALSADADTNHALLGTFPSDLLIVDTMFRDCLPRLLQEGSQHPAAAAPERHPLAGLAAGDFTEHDAPAR